jgi:thymidylate synthase (FAD)
MEKINVLDYGYVEYIDHMGSDQRIVDAARTSTGLDIVVDEKRNRQLIRYLIRHKHTSPFEFAEVTFKLKLPIFVMRQLIRHRTANVNEISGRYSELKTEYYTPEPDRIKGKGKFNKQGSEGEVDDLHKDTWLESLGRHFSDETDLYDMANSFGIANELTRISLPVSIYTECFFKMDLHNLMHFLKLRMDKHAQWEIRVYGEAIYSILKELFPLTMEAFDDYILNARTFSKNEMEIIKKLLSYPQIDWEKICIDELGKTETEEFRNKFWEKL